MADARPCTSEEWTWCSHMAIRWLANKMPSNVQNPWQNRRISPARKPSTRKLQHVRSYWEILRLDEIIRWNGGVVDQRPTWPMKCAVGFITYQQLISLTLFEMCNSNFGGNLKAIKESLARMHPERSFSGLLFSSDMLAFSGTRFECRKYSSVLPRILYIWWHFVLHYLPW